MKKYVKSTLIASAIIAAGVALAHDGALGDGMHKGMGQGMGMQHQPVDIATLLKLDATRAAQVNAILADERTQRQTLWEAHKTATHDAAGMENFRASMKTLREGTRTKLTALLTADELQKLRDTLGQGKHGGHGMMHGSNDGNRANHSGHAG